MPILNISFSFTPSADVIAVLYGAGGNELVSIDNGFTETSPGEYALLVSISNFLRTDARTIRFTTSGGQPSDPIELTEANFSDAAAGLGLNEDLATLFKYINSSADVITGAKKSFADVGEFFNGFSMGDLTGLGIPNSRRFHLHYKNATGTDDKIIWGVADNNSGAPTRVLIFLNGIDAASPHGIQVNNEGLQGGFAIMTEPSKDGYMLLMNDAFNSFSALVFGPVVSADWPMIKVVPSAFGRAFEMRKADDSTRVDLTVETLYAGQVVTDSFETNGDIHTAGEIIADQGLRVDGNIVVRAQQPGIPDTSGATTSELETEVNLLKALLRTHGLMET